MSVLEVMADLQPYCFEPERVPNAEDRESKNEEVNDRLEGTFWCTCERCETIPTQRECVCCREEPESENKKLVKEQFQPHILHLSRLQEVPRVTFLGKILKPTVSAKDLGVLLDPNLTYDHHISTVVSSCLSKLCQINRVKKSFDKTTLELLITALVFSKMLYCSSL